MAKFITAFLLSAILLVGSFAVMGMTMQTVSAKESVCVIDEGKNSCVISTKKGDVEIDKATITVNVQGQSFNSTGLEEQINNLEDAIEDGIANLQGQIDDIENQTGDGITSLEISEGESNGDNGGDNGSEGNGTDNDGSNETDGESQ